MLCALAPNQGIHLSQVGPFPLPTRGSEVAVAAKGQSPPVPKPSQTRSQMTHIWKRSQLPSLQTPEYKKWQSEL